MLRNLLKCIILFAIFTCFWGTPYLAKAAQLKIATIDMEYVFENFYQKKQADAALRQQDAIYESWVKKLLSSMKKLEDEYKILRDQSQNIALSNEEREDKRLDAQRKYKDFQQKKLEIRQYVSEKRRQFKQLEKKKCNKIIKVISKEVKRQSVLKGYDLVLDKNGKTLNGIPAVVYSKADMDITDKVLANLNRSKDDPGTDAAADQQIK